MTAHGGASRHRLYHCRRHAEFASHPLPWRECTWPTPCSMASARRPPPRNYCYLKKFRRGVALPAEEQYARPLFVFCLLLEVRLLGLVVARMTPAES